MEVLTNPTVVIVSQYVSASDHHACTLNSDISITSHKAGGKRIVYIKK